MVRSHFLIKLGRELIRSLFGDLFLTRPARATLYLPKIFALNSIILIVLNPTSSLANRGFYYSEIPNDKPAQQTSPKTDKTTKNPTPNDLDKKNMEELAKESQGNQNNLAILGTIAGGAAATRAVQCAAGCPKKGCCWQAPLWALGAALSFQTAKSSAQAAAQSYQSALDTSSLLNRQDDQENRDNNAGKNDPRNTLSAITKRSNELKKDLEHVCQKTKYCVDLDKNEVTAPDGKKASLNNLSQEDLSAMGLGPNSMDQIGSFMDKAFMEAKHNIDKNGQNKAALSIDKEDGESFFSSSSFGPIPNQTGMLPDLDNYSGMNHQNQKNKTKDRGGENSLEGLSVNFNGQPIGVSEENIFTLINRRYDLHAKNQSFIVQKVLPTAMGD